MYMEVCQWLTIQCYVQYYNLILASVCDHNIQMLQNKLLVNIVTVLSIGKYFLAIAWGEYMILPLRTP